MDMDASLGNAPALETLLNSHVQFSKRVIGGLTSYGYEIGPVLSLFPSPITEKPCNTIQPINS